MHITGTRLNHIENMGFEEIEIKESLGYWKEIGEYGEHAIITSADPNKILPDLRSIPGKVVIYAGPELMENSIHNEVVYTSDDLKALLEPKCVATLLPHGKPLMDKRLHL